MLIINRESKIFVRISQFGKKHKLTTMGNTTVFKSFILSKLTFLFSVLPDPPLETLMSLKQQSFELTNLKRLGV